MTYYILYILKNAVDWNTLGKRMMVIVFLFATRKGYSLLMVDAC